MYYHGIDAEHLQFHYPIINPRRSETNKTQNQLIDGNKLKMRFGFEPVHLLTCTESLTMKDCLQTCSRFGDTVLVFKNIDLPMLYLSRNERGVLLLDMREAEYCYVMNLRSATIISSLLPNLPIRIDSSLEKTTIRIRH